MNFKRRLQLPNKSCFLWGPRQCGKTTLLSQLFPNAFRIDLLKTDMLLKYKREPSLLRMEVEALPANQHVVIDEVQKVPELLDEVQGIIQQDKSRHFFLCGSSARKLKRNAGNLLGGRALKYELLGFSMIETGDSFSVIDYVNRGNLPPHLDSEDHVREQRAYVETYLREEVLEEGIVRSLPVFADFLKVAAIGDTEILNLSNVARECSVSAPTVREYFQILSDTLIGAFLPAYQKCPKRRTTSAPKFYFRDVGVVNHLLKRRTIEPSTENFGKAFENIVFHELSCHSKYSELWYELSYWRLTTGTEVDFVLGDAEVAIEVKAKQNIQSNDFRGLVEFKKEYPGVKKLIVLCYGGLHRRTPEGIEIFPIEVFLSELWAGKIIEN
jgi:predicted AAA+ superfamily ATPase